MCQKCRLSQPFPSLSPDKTQGASPAPVLFFSFLLFQCKLPLRAECALADGKLPVLCPLKHADPERSSKNTVSFPVTLYITKTLLFSVMHKERTTREGQVTYPAFGGGTAGLPTGSGTSGLCRMHVAFLSLRSDHSSLQSDL